ncbi:MAG: hypothetical protein L0958_03325 [Candidatus Mariimomonas ferrooxydans]
MKQEAVKVIKNAIESLNDQWQLDSVPDIEIEIPKNESLGDIATTVAMSLTKILKKPSEKNSRRAYSENKREALFF